MSNLIGQTLGRYHITEQLGEGGMATVYKAFDTRLETDVAVKVIRTERLAPEILEKSLKRFEREAKSLAKLTHPNIVKVTDYGEHEGKPYLVMPYLPGGTLKDRLKAGPIPWQESVHMLLPIVHALEYAHEHNLIHRDVKPSNILLTEKGQPMLTDFGVAKLFDVDETAELTGTGMGIGTPEYMAPEQWTGHVTPQTDIYALGVVLYEMVAGRKPYQADTPAALLLKQANDPLPRPRSFVSGLPEAVEKVLFKALAKGLEDRYQGMGEMVKAMEGLLAGKPVKEARPVRRVKEETLTAVEFDLGEKTQVDEKPIVRGKSTRRGWGWGVVAAGIVLLILAVVLASKPGAFHLFPTATATASLTPLPTLTITPSGTPEPTHTPTITPTFTPASTPTFKVGKLYQPSGIVISSGNINQLSQLTEWGIGMDTDVAWSPKGNKLAVTTEQGTYIYDATSLKDVVHIDGYAQTASFSPDGRILAIGGNGNVTIWSIVDGQQIRVLEHPGFVNRIAFSPDGRLLASGMYDRFNIRLWDVGSGTLIQELDPDGDGPYLSDMVNDLAFSPDGKILASADGNGQLLVWNVASRSLIAQLTGHYGQITSVVFSPNGHLMASGDGGGLPISPKILIWEVSTLNIVQTLDLGGGTPQSLDFSPNGNILIAGDTYAFWFWNAGNWELLKKIGSETGTWWHSARRVTFNADGTAILAGGGWPFSYGSGYIGIWGVSP